MYVAKENAGFISDFISKNYPQISVHKPTLKDGSCLVICNDFDTSITFTCKTTGEVNYVYRKNEVEEIKSFKKIPSEEELRKLLNSQK